MVISTIILSTLLVIVMFVLHTKTQEQLQGLKKSLTQVEGLIKLNERSADVTNCGSLIGRDKGDNLNSMTPQGTELFTVLEEEENIENDTDVEPFVTNAPKELDPSVDIIEIQSKDIRQFDQGNTICFCVPKNSVKLGSNVAEQPALKPKSAAPKTTPVKADTNTKSTKNVEPFTEIGVTYAAVSGSPSKVTVSSADSDSDYESDDD